MRAGGRTGGRCPGPAVRCPLPAAFLFETGPGNLKFLLLLREVVVSSDLSPVELG